MYHPPRTPCRDGNVRERLVQLTVVRVAATLAQGSAPLSGGAGPGHAGSVSASEFAFLAVGLILGVASGAALVEVLRARPPAPREVRVTVSPDAIPRRRGTTLAEDAFALAAPQPARGGPADHRVDGAQTDWQVPGQRTAVRSGGGVADPGLEPSYRMTAPDRAAMAVGTAPPAMVGFRVEPGRDPMLQTIQRAGSATRRSPATMGPAKAAATVGTALAVLEPPGDDIARAQSPETHGPDAGTEPLAPRDADGPCAEARQVAMERCEATVRTRAGVRVADETLRVAQRAYDAHVSRAEDAAAATDPGTVRAEKEAAQTAFREARGRATESPGAVEAAARDWLGEINRINTVVRDASAVAIKEREAAATIAPSLERLALEADAARIKAEAAEAACLTAREAVAECVEAQDVDERAARPHAPPVPGGPGPDTPGPRVSGSEPFVTEDEPLAAAFGAGQTPVIFLLLRGDSAVMERTVARLTSDPAEQRRWQASLSELVDAVVAVSIGQSTLDFPPDHAFWGPFTREQDRDIVVALSSLGFRFDGLGGWADDRAPSQRDLSMALGYAGLDPMRVRHWPTEAEMRDLFAEVTVAADQHLAGAAGDLTLGELVAMLGRRADGLAMLWNDWGRVRLLLLEDA